MAVPQLQFINKFVGGGAARLRVLEAAAGSNPDVAIHGELAAHLEGALPQALFGSTPATAARPALRTVSHSVVELTLGRCAVPVDPLLGAEPFYGWVCELATLAKFHDQLDAGGFMWPQRTTLEGLAAAIDAHMASLQGFEPFHLELAGTRQVELSTLDLGGDGREFKEALAGAKTQAVFVMGQPMGVRQSTLFHLTPRYRAAEREDGEFHDAVLLVVNSFLEDNKGLAGMSRSWVVTQALIWFLRAEFPRHLWQFQAGPSGSSCLRLVRFWVGDKAYREWSFEEALPFYLGLGEHSLLKDVLSDADGVLCKTPQPLTRRLAVALTEKGSSVLSFSPELLDFLELTLGSTAKLLTDEARALSARGKVDFILASEARAVGLADGKQSAGEAGGSAPEGSATAVASMVRDLMADGEFQLGIAVISALVDAGDATVNDFVRAAFASKCLALIKHFVGKKKIPGFHATLALPGCLGMASFLAQDLGPVSRLVMPLIFDLDLDEGGNFVTPDRLLYYRVSGTFLLGLLSGATWDFSPSCDLFGEIVVPIHGCMHACLHVAL
jgi:hypothetical protein